jgi:hypothetical protein
MDIPLTDILKKITSKDKRLEIYYDIASERVIIRHDNAAWNYPTIEEAIAGFIGSHIRGDRK